MGAARAAGPPLLFGLRLWASVCLALYVAFWLELDNAYWAGTSAALVCQPHREDPSKNSQKRLVDICNLSGRRSRLAVLATRLPALLVREKADDRSDEPQ
jgi:hypothetical protein